MLEHADHVLSAKVDEGIEIEARLLEATDIDSLQGVRSAKAEFIGTESDGGAMSCVGGVDGSGAGGGASFGPDPERGDGGGGMGIGDFGQWEQEGWVDDVLVYGK